MRQWAQTTAFLCWHKRSTATFSIELDQFESSSITVSKYSLCETWPLPNFTLARCRGLVNQKMARFKKHFYDKMERLLPLSCLQCGSMKWSLHPSAAALQTLQTVFLWEGNNVQLSLHNALCFHYLIWLAYLTDNNKKIMTTRQNDSHCNQNCDCCCCRFNKGR